MVTAFYSWHLVPDRGLYQAYPGSEVVFNGDLQSTLGAGKLRRYTTLRATQVQARFSFCWAIMEIHSDLYKGSGTFNPFHLPSHTASDIEAPDLSGTDGMSMPFRFPNSKLDHHKYYCQSLAIVLTRANFCASVSAMLDSVFVSKHQGEYHVYHPHYARSSLQQRRGNT
ncbi:MAG: hypothetical protein GFH27_549301n181 [Chloroflexi bacterium AL-W]|nr:hypothetical protein [Chloroflexi bacterium AL-N1]NOK68374.1 hypothetical protein [Chloroflexi bacterium AL-N10]NOK74020.1 hypothetical protein [Chloroflexi bacterium AL-N5]NOK82988.1 hypothetical protein [Chloroflexi bacterium AL-W]NOK90510.1 hypothetical protein [Chloroflexi bacterium AL-N15]